MSRWMLIPLCFLLGFHAPAWAASAAQAIEVEDPFVRMVPPGAPATAAFMVIQNTSDQDHALVSAKAQVNQVTELHTHIHDKGVMRMREVPQIELPANQTTELAPGGLHIMLIDLKAPIEKGQLIPIELTFEDGSKQTIEAVGKPLMKPMMKHKGHMSGKKLGNGQDTHPMRLVMHANPAFPNLTGIVVKHADQLGLSDAQLKQVKAWPQKHSQTMKGWFHQIRNLEKELIQETLAGKSQSELMKTFEHTLDLRRKVAETKIQCRDNLKKILSKAQFKQLASIYPMM